MRRNTFGAGSVRQSDPESRPDNVLAEEADDALVADFREKLLDEIDLT